MARDTYIVRPDRLDPPIKAALQDLSRDVRIQMLVDQILSRVRDNIKARTPLPPQAYRR